MILKKKKLDSKDFYKISINNEYVSNSNPDPETSLICKKKSIQSDNDNSELRNTPDLKYVFRSSLVKQRAIIVKEGMEIGDYIVSEFVGKRRKFVENARKTRFWFERLKIAELSCAVMALIGVIFSVIAYDIDFVVTTSVNNSLNLNQQDLKSVRSIFLYMVMISTAILAVIVVIRYNIRMKLYKARKILKKEDTFISTKIIYYLVSELILIFIIPTTFLEDVQINSLNDFENLSTIYSLNDIFTMLIFSRVVLVVRVVIVQSVYYSNSANRLGALFRFNCSYKYVLKCLMKKYPLQILLTTFICSIFYFAYLLKISERPLVHAIMLREIPNNANYYVKYDLSDYLNCLWLMIITMTTVGYGDYTPKTISGRFVTVFACFTGLINISMIIVIFQNLFMLSMSESRALAVIEKMVDLKKKKFESAYVLTYLGRLGFFCGKLIDPNPKNNTKIIKKMNYRLKNIKKIGLNSKDANKVMFFTEEITRKMMFIKEELGDIERELEGVTERCLEMLEDNNLLNMSELNSSIHVKV